MKLVYSIEEAGDFADEVETLDLSGGSTPPSADILTLWNLTTLVLDDTTFTSLPDDIEYLPQLRTVSANNANPALLVALEKLPNLEELDFSRTPLDYARRDAFEDIGRLQTLRVLRLDHCKLQRLPATLPSLRRLEVLSACHNELSRVGPELSLLPALRELWLDGNRLVDVPAEVRGMPTLTIFSTDENPWLGDVAAAVVRVPDRWLREALGLEGSETTAGRLARVEEIDWNEDRAEAGLQFGHVEDLAGLEHCRALRTLSLIGHGVVDTTPLAPCANLREVWLEDGALQNLGGLSDKRHLEVLMLARNYQLRDLRPLSGCESLKRLDLSSTAVTNLDPLKFLFDLEWVRLWDLELDDTSLEILDAWRTRGVEVDGPGT